MSKNNLKKKLDELIEEADEIYSFYYKFSKNRKDSKPIYKKALDKAKKENKKLEIEYLLGKIALIDKDFVNAINHFDYVIEINEYFLNAWLYKGSALNSLFKHKEALKCFDKALEIDPKYIHALNNKGVALMDLDQSENALKCFDRALEIDPDYAHALNNKGLIKYEYGNYDEALSIFDTAIHLNKNYIPALMNKGLVLEDMGKPKKALECYNNAEKLDPEDETIRDNINLILMRLGKVDETSNELENLYYNHKKNLEKWNLSEKQKKERFLELDAQQEVRKELSSEYKAILDEKEFYEKNLACSLKPRSEPLTDNFLIILRRWNSYTPTLVTSTESNLGGGYFLYWNGKGIVIDPGFDFINNFFSNGLLVHDIDAIIITHAHIDHCADFESILTLIYEYNDKNYAKKKIDVFMNLGAMKKFLGWIPIEENSQDCKINRIYPLERDNELNLEKYGMKIIPTKAIHNEILSKTYSVGIILELYDINQPDFSFKIGYTSDTKHEEEIEEQYKDVDIIIPNMNSIEYSDFKLPDKKLKRNKNHLMLTGVISTIYKSNAKLAIISEFGEELGEHRTKIVAALNKVFQDNRMARCLTGDIGLTVKIPDLEVRCAYCSYNKNKEHYKKQNKRPAYCSFEGNGETYVKLENILEDLDPDNKSEKSVVNFCDKCKRIHSYKK